MQSFKDGMDFYYAERNQAARFTEFLEAVCPIKVKQSKKLVGQDDHSNIFNFKYTTIVEIVPVRTPAWRHVMISHCPTSYLSTTG